MRQQLIMRNGVVKTEQAHATDLEQERQALLQEVREVLNALRLSPDCWCVTRWKGSHDGRCQRARALMERLAIPEVRP